MKKLVLVLIAFFLVICADLSLVVQKGQAAKPKPSNLIVYYFHGNFRCSSCLKIEQYTKESIEVNFKDKIKSGQIVFGVINVADKENEHYIKDYQLYTKSVIVSLTKNGKQLKWKNLTKVWEYLRNKPRFLSYIKDEVDLYLKEL
ncbi:MAG: nitrophenyl compound nitroreductase subunit ArsF family protein [Candidatus Saganbacteria bacterium]|nr:nitrophenyl compound nitroreductase subunit ArsF family protein [Candidatus Saganbacteria bacterium]